MTTGLLFVINPMLWRGGKRTNFHQLMTTKSWEKIIDPVGDNNKPFCHLGRTKTSILYIDPPLLGLQKMSIPFHNKRAVSSINTNELEE